MDSSNGFLFSCIVKVSMIKTRKLFKTHVPSFQMFVFMFVSHGFEKTFSRKVSV